MGWLTLLKLSPRQLTDRLSPRTFSLTYSSSHITNTNLIGQYLFASSAALVINIITMDPFFQADRKVQSADFTKLFTTPGPVDNCQFYFTIALWPLDGHRWETDENFLHHSASKWCDQDCCPSPQPTPSSLIL